jgi:uncharacterized cupin superfamily protein
MSIVRGDEVAFVESRQGQFQSQRKTLSRIAGAANLHCSLYEVEPGKTAFPFHAHHVTEEAIYVLAGCGRLRLGIEEHALAPGDYVALPPGAQHAHQLVCEGPDVLRYLCFAGGAHADVVEYPDSDKIGVLVGNDSAERTLQAFFRASEQVPYFDGEDGADT